MLKFKCGDRIIAKLMGLTIKELLLRPIVDVIKQIIYVS